MPLAFTSESHGKITFGFVNIEIDILMLEHLFFFADGFCRAVVDLARSEDGEAEVEIEGYRIDDPAAIGDLHGAIRGMDISGFIGAAYARYPFPRETEFFKQNPQGDENRAWVAHTIRSYSKPHVIKLRDCGDVVKIDDIEFSREVFEELVNYIDRGGYPRWKDERRPAYVREMWKQLEEAGSSIARG